MRYTCNISIKDWQGLVVKYTLNISWIYHEYVMNLSWICHEYIINLVRQKTMIPLLMSPQDCQEEFEVLEFIDCTVSGGKVGFL